MSKLGLAIHEVHSAEKELADRLATLGERHKADHDVYHLTRTLAKLAAGHVAELAELGKRYGTDSLDPQAGGEGVLSALREKGSELVGRRPEPGLLLLRDLRELHLAAAHASIAWTILGQGAQGAKDRELLAVVGRCHAETLRILKWTVTRIKEAAPQALAA